jgi:acetyl-CoA carboxylase carboxyl transferase subunit alpha
MFGLRVPILSLVIGEGGSGGALAIGCANKNLILENSVYYVASPEACAAILWKNRGAAGQVGGQGFDSLREIFKNLQHILCCG